MIEEWSCPCKNHKRNRIIEDANAVANRLLIDNQEEYEAAILVPSRMIEMQRKEISKLKSSNENPLVRTLGGLVLIDKYTELLRQTILQAPSNFDIDDIRNFSEELINITNKLRQTTKRLTDDMEISKYADDKSKEIKTNLLKINPHKMLDTFFKEKFSMYSGNTALIIFIVIFIVGIGLCMLLLRNKSTITAASAPSNPLVTNGGRYRY